MIPLVYDQINLYERDKNFFRQLLQQLEVKTLADVGCGTGRLTLAFAEDGYHITAIDPHEGAIAYAKKKVAAQPITWIVGDSRQLRTNTYDAVVMTANVAQVFVTEESWHDVVADVFRALKPGGHFIFDTRNPLAKVWEQWMQDTTPDSAVDEVSGEPLDIWTHYEGTNGDVLTYIETVKRQRTGEVIAQEKSRLKFRTKQVIEQALQQAGFVNITVYGDWTFTVATPQTQSFIFHSVKGD
ncbi:class I SAM-dependent methyltransferase [Caryophanon tenue]|uniref:SAM-dependent methyltransferase n=1 Tax=Caryophanon tenue TaxID=33978 RepID=A0A1C0Y6P9_9BACL|nr:class I SAM-dependent methyltransferase [Caryophanon tenue]OCS82832.1 SAM-dependent methyltransferase [Caryophanon tenue]